MTIKWYDPYLTISSQERVVNLEDIARECDVITLHASVKSDNREMIDSNFFESIKPDNKTVFVNMRAASCFKSSIGRCSEKRSH